MGLSRRAFLGGIMPALGLGIAGCVEQESPPEGDVVVSITDEYTFDPETVEVHTGETVVWIHEGRGMHSVTAYQDSVPDPAAYFASGGATSEFRARLLYPILGTMGPGDFFAHTFEIPGEYRYFSIPAEDGGMVGTVVVVPS